MKAPKRLGLLLDLILLAASVATGGPVGPQLQAVALVVAIAIGALVLFCAVVLTIAVVQQRQPPYEL